MCSQQHLVDQPSVVLFCNTCVYVLTAAIGLPKLFKWSKLQVTCSAPDMCVQKHTCVCPQAAIGRPTFDPWVQPSMDCLTAAIGLLKLLNVQNLHLASSLDYSATHMCVFTVHSSNRSPNPQLSSSATHMCMCLQQQSVCQSFLNGQSFK